MLFLVHAKDSAFTTGEYEVTRSSGLRREKTMMSSCALDFTYDHKVLVLISTSVENKITFRRCQCNDITGSLVPRPSSSFSEYGKLRKAWDNLSHE